METTLKDKIDKLFALDDVLSKAKGDYQNQLHLVKLGLICPVCRRQTVDIIPTLGSSTESISCRSCGLSTGMAADLNSALRRWLVIEDAIKSTEKKDNESK